MAGRLSRLEFRYRPGEDADVVGRDVVGGIPVETWRFGGSRGDVVPADAYVPDGVRAVVVAGHGRADSRAAQYVRGSALQRARVGIATIAADAPLHGERAGERPIPRATIADVDLVVRWVDDHRLLLDAVERRFGIGIPMLYVGLSMGAVMGCHLLAEDERLRAGILLVGGSTTVSVPERFGGAGPDLRARLELTDPEIPAGRIAPRPVLMVNADADEVFSRRSALALYDALGHPKELTFLPGRHGEWRSPAQWSRRQYEFIEHVLAGAGRP